MRVTFVNIDTIVEHKVIQNACPYVYSFFVAPNIARAVTLIISEHSDSVAKWDMY